MPLINPTQFFYLVLDRVSTVRSNELPSPISFPLFVNVSKNPFDLQFISASAKHSF